MKKAQLMEKRKKIMSSSTPPQPSSPSSSSPTPSPSPPPPRSIKDAAIAYHQAGLRVVLLHNLTVHRHCSCQLGEKCLHAGKHPRKGGWNKPGVGMIESADDIRDAFQRYPRANIGIITGGSQFSNLICIDVDPKHGGEESLAALISAPGHAPFPPTWQARTGSGGSHYLFRHPGPDYIVRNSQADDKKHHPKLGSGLDVKGDRGQFVAAPSAHASGKRYEWVNAPGGDVGLAELPGWLLELIAEKKDGGKKRRKTIDERRAQRRENKSKRITTWASKALAAECDRVINAPAGTGNDILNQAAYNIGQIVAGGSLEETEAIAALLDAATANGRRPEEEASKTIHSGLQSGKSQPRTPPEKEKNSSKADIKKQSPSNSSEATKEKANSNNSNLVYFDNDNSHRLAKLFMERWGYHSRGSNDEMQKLYYWQEDMHQWRVGQNHYQIVPEAGFKADVNSFIQQTFINDAEEEAEESGKRTKCKNVTKQLVSNVIGAIQSIALLRTSKVSAQPAWLGHPSERKNWIAVNNGLLDVDSIETAQQLPDCLSSPSPQWFSPSCMPVDYDPSAQCPIWMQFLEKTFSGDRQIIDMLQEWFGYCLTHETKYQKFLMMVSDGGHGKGVVAAAIEAIIGKINMSFVPLERFGERFDLGTTLGKQVNLIADANEIDRVAEGHLKSFVVGDSMFFDRKNQPGIQARPTAKLMIFANRLPYFGDRSQGIWRRLLLVPFHVTVRDSERIAGMDKPEWWESQPGEKSGILNWAIEGLLRLQKNDWFVTPDKIKDEIEKHRIDCNPVAYYLTENCAESEDAIVTTEELYEAYVKWCKATNHKIENERRFGKEVVKAFSSATKTRPGNNSNRQYVYKGIKINTILPI